MDEYLFLVVAKLKADRRKLERERDTRLAALAPHPIHHETSARGVRGHGKSLSKLEWREQS
jgi:hypothetical protein